MVASRKCANCTEPREKFVGHVEEQDKECVFLQLRRKTTTYCRPCWSHLVKPWREQVTVDGDNYVWAKEHFSDRIPLIDAYNRRVSKSPRSSSHRASMPPHGTPWKRPSVDRMHQYFDDQLKLLTNFVAKMKKVQDSRKLYPAYVKLVLQRRLLNNVFRRRLQKRLPQKSPQRSFLVRLFSPFRSKVKALRVVSQLTGVPTSTVSRIFESQEATSTVHRSDMRAKTTVQYIPRVDPERVDWLLKWIDEHVPVKSGTDRRVRMATWMHLYANYKADAQAAGQKPLGYKAFRKMFVPFHIWHVNYWWFVCPYCYRLKHPEGEVEPRDLAHQVLKDRQMALLKDWKEKCK